MVYLIVYFLICCFSGDAEWMHESNNTGGARFQPRTTLFLMGRSSVESDTSFTKLPSWAISYGPQYMQKQAADSFLVMYKQAKNEGVVLTVISAYRSYDVQKQLWNAAWGRYRSRFADDRTLVENILRYLSMPGTSRHHWGTEVDVCSLSLTWWQSAQGTKTYQWLTDNARRYGFYQPYGKLGVTRSTGYHEEQWHWSFFPIATELTAQYADSVEYSMFSGFNGARYAEDIGVIQNYVLSVEAFELK